MTIIRSSCLRTFFEPTAVPELLLPKITNEKVQRSFTV